MGGIKNYKTGIIGAGNMGGAVISALSKNVDPANIFVCEIYPEKLKTLPTGVQIEKNPASLSPLCDIIILAVKPDAVYAVLDELKSEKNPVIVSIAAGISIAAIESRLGSGREVVRVMPNTPLSIGRGVSVISANENTTEKNLNAVADIFGSAGKVLILPEKMMDAVTGVSGSGPALVFTFIQAMADGGVKAGLPRREALEIASETVAGAAQMIIETGIHPISCRDSVASPGGTTVEAINLLEREGFSGIIIDAIEAAAKKSAKLGEL